MNTKGKIDFTKTDNIQFIEEVAREISKEDKNWQWEAREIKQHSLLLWWEYLEDEKQEGFFGCKAYMYMDDIPTQKIVKISRYSTEQEDDKE